MFNNKKEIDFNNVLFHGLTYYETGNIRIKLGLQRLINIIRAKAILSRKQVYNTFGNEYYEKRQNDFCRVNWNGLNNVSVCEKGATQRKKRSEVFKLFVENSISLILDKNLLNELEVVSDGQLEDGEYQIKDKIDGEFHDKEGDDREHGFGCDNKGNNEGEGKGGNKK